MKTGRMLERLIAIAQIAKTDLAASINMTPSGLSKILGGSRLPFYKEKRGFSNRAARRLAGAMYGPNCYMKFGGLFPLIYDFSSKLELELFLSHAIEYALDQDYAAENGEGANSPERNLSFLGKGEVLNMLCLIVSDLLVSSGDDCLAFYSTLPFLDRHYADLLGNVKICCPGRLNNVSLNQYFDISAIETALDEFDLGAFTRTVTVADHVDLNLWCVDKKINHCFLLAKRHFLLIFSTQLDGAPMMTLIRNRGYQAIFYNTLMRIPAQKISYGTDEAIAFLDANPAFLRDLTEQGIDLVCNSLPIGYMLEAGDLTPAQTEKAHAKSMLDLFHNILQGSALFDVTLDAMLNIAMTGKAVMPLVGAVELAPDHRIPYLQRFLRYADGRSAGKIRIINRAMPKAAILCAGNLALVYVTDDAHTYEKILCLEADMIRRILDGELSKHEVPPLHFNMDLWDMYIEEVARNLPR